MGKITDRTGAGVGVEGRQGRCVFLVDGMGHFGVLCGVGGRGADGTRTWEASAIGCGVGICGGTVVVDGICFVEVEIEEAHMLLLCGKGSRSRSGSLLGQATRSKTLSRNGWGFWMWSCSGSRTGMTSESCVMLESGRWSRSRQGPQLWSWARPMLRA